MTLKRGSIFKERSSNTGTAADVAGELAALFEAEVCDGFVVTPAHLPRGFDVFVSGAAPELQRCRLLRGAYRGATLREHLGEGRG